MKSRKAKLTPSEVDVLRRRAAGEKVAEIAESWGMSGTMVYRTLQRARRTMGARSHHHAVALFIERFRNGDPIT